MSRSRHPLRRENVRLTRNLQLLQSQQRQITLAVDQLLHPKRRVLSLFDKQQRQKKSRQ